MKGFTIGDVANASGVKVTTIRFYEQRGILPNPDRTPSGQRQYVQTDIARLQFIRHARDLGFDLDAIAQLLALSDSPGQDCSAADSIAHNQLAAVIRRITQLTDLRHELERMITTCTGGTVTDCRVIQSLGNHGLCAHDHDGPPGAGL